MAKGSSSPRRWRLRKQPRRESARRWIASGARVTVKTYSTWYRVDRYTAYDDLVAIGFPLTPGDARWAVRPPPTPKRAPIEPDVDEPEWVWAGDGRMFVVGYTSGGAPYGYVEEEPGGGLAGPVRPRQPDVGRSGVGRQAGR